MRVSLRNKIMLLVLLILVVAVGLISFQGLRFFHRDKTTYVFDLIQQVANVQAMELEKKVVSLQHLIEIFSEMATVPMALDKRDSFYKKFSDFLYLATYHRQGQVLVDELVIANRTLLSSMGIDANQLKNQKYLQAALQNSEPFQLINLTMNSSHPLVALLWQDGSERVALGLLHQNTLLDITQSKRVYHTFVVDKAGEVVLHGDRQALLQRQNLAELPMVKSWLDNPQLPMTREYELPTGDKLLSSYVGLRQIPYALFVEVPKEQAFLAARRLVRESGAMVLVVLLLSCALGIAFAYSITRPVRQLASLTQRIAHGDFTAKAKISTRDEIGELATSFNRMSDELKLRDEKLEASNRQLVQSEKMSAFGQMSAGIAHEVKNPLAGILGYAQLARRKLEEGSPLIKYIDTIEKETKRCKEIIENLMKFARQEKAPLAPFQLNQAVRDALNLVRHQLGIGNVNIQEALADDTQLPEVLGSINQIEQVLMNLMLNAQQAMEWGGTLTITTRQVDAQFAAVEVADTGSGIKPENIKKIFEPFFTTKPAGKGTGLGLAVTYGIVKDHHGDIQVQSQVGKGTTFKVLLPLANTAAA